jgi:choline transport protein
MADESAPPTTEKASMEAEFARRRGTIVSIEDGVAINASGHKDQLKRQYGLLGICGLALNIDNAWIALGGSVTIAIGEYSTTPWRLSPHAPSTAADNVSANGGPPGVLYELIVACSYYAVVAACIAEVSVVLPTINYCSMLMFNSSQARFPLQAACITTRR